jgi:hypothetical protein
MARSLTGIPPTWRCQSRFGKTRMRAPLTLAIDVRTHSEQRCHLCRTLATPLTTGCACGGKQDGGQLDPCVGSFGATST